MIRNLKSGVAAAVVLAAVALAVWPVASSPAATVPLGCVGVSAEYYSLAPGWFEATDRGPDGGTLTWDVRTTLPGALAHQRATFVKLGDQTETVREPVSVVVSLAVSRDLGLTWCSVPRVARPAGAVPPVHL